MRFARFVQLGVLATLLGGGSVGCGNIDIPLDLALVGEDNIIVITPPSGPVLSTDLVGGVETTISVNLGLFSLLNPNGIMAGISVDDLLFAGRNIPIIPGVLRTGVLCIEDDLANPGGGAAHMRILQGQADFQFALNTTIRGTDANFLAFLDALGVNPYFPFQAVVEANDVPLTFADMLGLLLGGGGSAGLEISQEIHTELPADIPLLGGAQVDGNLTLATVEAIPADPRLANCVTP